MKSILVIDNYDSFTYNLVHLLRELHQGRIDVIRNDKFSLVDVDNYEAILLSPGPGIPIEAGLMVETIRKYAPSKSILGVCLGHQGIAEVFGAKLLNMKTVMHGKSSEIQILNKNSPLFQNITQPILVGRYHSWLVSRDNFPECLKITAEDEKGAIMAIQHVEYNVLGIQFHPESVLTPQGRNILENWLKSLSNKFTGAIQ